MAGRRVPRRAGGTRTPAPLLLLLLLLLSSAIQAVGAAHSGSQAQAQAEAPPSYLSPYSGSTRIPPGGLVAAGPVATPYLASGAMGFIGLYGYNSSSPVVAFNYTGGSAASEFRHVHSHGSDSTWGAFTSEYVVLGGAGGRSASVNYTFAAALFANESSSTYIGGWLNVSGVNETELPAETEGSPFNLAGYVYAYPGPVNLSVYDSSAKVVEYSGGGHIISVNLTLPRGLFYLIFKGYTHVVYTLKLSYSFPDPSLWHASPGLSCYPSGQASADAAVAALTGSLYSNATQSAYAYSVFGGTWTGNITEVFSVPVEVYTTYGAWETFTLEEYAVLDTWNGSVRLGGILLNATGPTSQFTYGVAGPGSLLTAYEYGYYGPASTYYEVGGGGGQPVGSGLPPTLAATVGVVKGEGVTVSEGYLSNGSRYVFPFNITILFPDAASAWVLSHSAPAYYPYPPYGYGAAAGVELTLVPGSPVAGFRGLTLNSTGWYFSNLSTHLDASIYVGGQGGAWAPASECYPYTSGLYTGLPVNTSAVGGGAFIFTAGGITTTREATVSPPPIHAGAQPTPGVEAGLGLNITLYFYTPHASALGGKVLFLALFGAVVGGGFVFALAVKRRRGVQAGGEAGEIGIPITGQAASSVAEPGAGGVPPQAQPEGDGGGGVKEEAVGGRGEELRVSVPKASYDYREPPNDEEKARLREEYERVKESIVKMLAILSKRTEEVSERVERAGYTPMGADVRYPRRAGEGGSPWEEETEPEEEDHGEGDGEGGGGSSAGGR